MQLRSLSPILVLLTVLSPAMIAGGCAAAPEEDSATDSYNPCGRLSILIEGQVGSRTFQGRHGILLEGARSVAWSTPVGATGTGLDAREAQAPVTAGEAGREFSATVDGSDGDRLDMQVAGTIAADCSASGSWALLDPHNGRLRGVGTWSTQ